MIILSMKLDSQDGYVPSKKLQNNVTKSLQRLKKKHV